MRRLMKRETDGGRDDFCTLGVEIKRIWRCGRGEVRGQIQALINAWGKTNLTLRRGFPVDTISDHRAIDIASAMSGYTTSLDNSAHYDQFF